MLLVRRLSTDSEHVGDLLPGPALIPGSAYLRRLELLKQPPEGSYRPQAGLWVAVRCRRGEFIDFTHACQLTLTGIAASIYVDEWVPAGEKVRTDRSTPVRRAGPSPLPGWRARWPSAPRSGASRHTGMMRRLCSRPQRRACTVPRRRSDAGRKQGFDWWRGSVVDDARRLLAPGCWLAVSTQAGATDDEDFPGWAALIGAGGHVVAELPDWREGTLVVGLPA